MTVCAAAADKMQSKVGRGFEKLETSIGGNVTAGLSTG
jgi:hypothetical protein